jgi:diaminopimelate epimerase
MPGGQLGIEVHPDFTVRMTGPVVKVLEGELAQEALAGVI